MVQVLLVVCSFRNSGLKDFVVEAWLRVLGGCSVQQPVDLNSKIIRYRHIRS